MAKQPEVLSLDPQYLGDVLEDVRRVGRATGSEAVADRVTSRMQERIDDVTQRASLADTRPKVLHLEWTDPLMCGGHWVPEMVELAGGTNCFGDKEMGSFPLEWDAVVESQPEVIVLMPCGFEVPRALQDVPLLTEKEGWDKLPAVQNNRVFAIDASNYTSRSGPRLVTGLEILAEMTHPELFSGMVPEMGARRIYA
ncbi:MAG: ABC transporter substrate-binding protein [Chloroflexi bacterium]|nr:ABC transporter substrate-binding protein [Chloroflexota bacterium]MYD48076.1 ABC transporter substrate-binding protein [Chloroflexota bacterium]